MSPPTPKKRKTDTDSEASTVIILGPTEFRKMWSFYDKGEVEASKHVRPFCTIVCSVSNSTSSFEGVITSLAGSVQKAFTVHKDIACKHSEFLRNAITGDWKEAKNGVIKFPEEQPNTV